MINVFYQTHINHIGGVETFLYELARLAYREHRDLTIIYRTGDSKQIQRLRNYCNCVALSSVEKPIKCKRAFFNYGIDAIDYFEADEYIQLIHADFKDKSLSGYPVIQSSKFTKYYAVSKHCAKSFFELTENSDVGVVYNPIQVDDEPRIMTLLSAQRMTCEKGVARLEKLVEQLDKNNIPYIWHLFTTDKLSIESDNLVYHTPTLDIRRWMKYADYTVILSDTEGFCYGAYESLCLGTPVIMTDLPVLDELGTNSSNSIILDFDLSNLDVNDIYRRAGTFKFKYEPKPSNDWLDIITGESTYTPPKLVKIQALQRYTDIQLNKLITVDDVYEVFEDRANQIIGIGYAKKID